MNDGVEIRHFPGKGRGLVARRTIAAGEAVIVEEPLLLTVSQEAKAHACAHCLCWLDGCPGALTCESCHQVRFCSQQCQEQATAKAWVHAPAACRAYALLPQLLPGNLEAQSSLRFLIQAAGMKAAAAAAAATAAGGGAAGPEHAYGQLLGLVGEAAPEFDAQAAQLHPALCSALGGGCGGLLSRQEVAALLAKEQLNSYGLLAPLQHQPGRANSTASSSSSDGAGSRRLRGGGLYPAAALVNHECLPNLARFDALDAPAGGPTPAQWPSGGSSARLVLRALHALPPGTELSASYFPLHWRLAERQQQAQQVYGFTCCCPRCLLESSPEWQQQQEDGSSGEWETDSGDGDASDMEADHHQQPPEQPQQAQSSEQQQPQQPGQQPALDPAYLSLFLLKFMCPVEGCFGTMAALQGTDLCECSVCGTMRSEAQFLAGLEEQQ